MQRGSILIIALAFTGAAIASLLGMITFSDWIARVR